MARPGGLVPPPGYVGLERLDRRQHAGMGRIAAPGYAWARGLPAIPLDVIEIARAALDYPIAFVRDPRGGGMQPMALTGAAEGQNRFVNAEGQWQPGCYLPAYLRRWPFCTVEVPGAPGLPGRHLICVEAGALGPVPPALFDADGKPTDAFDPYQQLMSSMEAARQATRLFMQRLGDLGLLVPFDAVLRPAHAPPLQIRGLHRVDETRLGSLSASGLQGLQRKGALKALYAHLLSLENFARLLPD